MILASQLAFAQVVNIRVQNAENAAPIVHARLAASNSNARAKTDSTGQTTLPCHDVPTVYIIAAPGFNTDSVTIPDKHSIRSSSITVHLRPFVYDFGEITVEGSRPNMSSASYGVARISAAELMYHITPGGEIDVFEGLKALPGVTAVSDFSSGIRVRGLGFQYNQVLVDGVELYHPYHMAGFMGTVQSDLVRGMDFYRDVAPAHYGGKLSSVVDIATRTPRMDRFHSSFSLSVTNASLCADIPVTDSWGLMVGGRSMYLSPVVKEISDNAIQYNFHDIYVKNLINLDGINSITVSGLYAFDDANIDSKEYFKDYYFDGSWTSFAGAAHWVHTPNTAEQLHVRLGMSDFHLAQQPRNLIDGIFVEFTWGIRDYLLHSSYIRRMGSHELTISFDGDFMTTMYGDYYSAEQLFSPDAITGDRMSATAFALSVEDAWTISPRWFMQAGLRMAYHPYGQFVEPQPRISVLYSPGESFSFRAAVGRNVQFVHDIPRLGIPIPNEQRIFSSESYPPERMNSISIGGMWTVARDYPGILRVDGYYRDMENIYGIVDYPDRGTITIGKGTGDAYGVECSYEGSLGNVFYRGSYALGWSNRSFDELHAGAPFPAKDDIRHDALAEFRWKIVPYLEAGATWRIFSGSRMTIPIGMYTSAPGGATFPLFSERNAYRLPAYHRLDLFVRYTFDLSGAKAGVFVNLYNAYNQNNSYYYYFYDDGLRSSYPYVFDSVEVLPILPSIGFNVAL